MTTRTDVLSDVGAAMAAADAVWAGLPGLSITRKLPAAMDTKYARGWTERVKLDSPMHRFRYPGTSTGDPEYREFLNDLIERLEDELPARELVGGATDGCSTRGHQRLRHLAGYPMVQGQQPPLNSRHMRKLKGLEVTMSDADLVEASTLLNGILDAIEERVGLPRRGLNVDITTSAGLANGGVGARKIAAVMAVLSSTVAMTALSARDCDVRTRLQLPRGYVKGSRANQADSFVNGRSKDRPVTTPAQDRGLLTGTLKKEDIQPADKTLAGVSDFSRMRVRMVYAYPAGENVLLSLLADPVRVGLKAAFPLMRLDTLAHLSEMDHRALRAGLSEVLAADTTNFDGFFPLQLLALMCATFERRYGWGRLAWDVLTAPILATDDQLGEKGARLIGDPFSMDRLDNALTSGLGPNSLFGSLGQILNIAVALRKRGVCGAGVKPVLDMLDAAPSAAVWFGTQSDDVAYWATPRAAAALRSAPLDAWIPTDLEYPGKYKGYIRVKLPEGERWAMDSSSWLVNLFMKEDDAYKRPFMAAGLRSAIAVYDGAPDLDEYVAILSDTLGDHYGVNLASAVGADKVVPTVRSDEDRMFLLNREYIHYKIDPSLISPELLAGELHTIPPSMGINVAKAWRTCHTPQRTLI